MDDRLVEQHAILAALDWQKDYSEKYGLVPDSAFLKIYFNRMISIHHDKFDYVEPLNLTDEELRIASDRGYLNDTDEQWMDKEDSDD